MALEQLSCTPQCFQHWQKRKADNSLVPNPALVQDECGQAGHQLDWLHDGPRIKFQIELTQVQNFQVGCVQIFLQQAADFCNAFFCRLAWKECTNYVANCNYLLWQLIWLHSLPVWSKDFSFWSWWNALFDTIEITWGNNDILSLYFQLESTCYKTVYSLWFSMHLLLLVLHRSKDASWINFLIRLDL